MTALASLLSPRCCLAACNLMPLGAAALPVWLCRSLPAKPPPSALAALPNITFGNDGLPQRDQRLGTEGWSSPFGDVCEDDLLRVCTLCQLVHVLFPRLLSWLMVGLQMRMGTEIRA